MTRRTLLACVIAVAAANSTVAAQDASIRTVVYHDYGQQPAQQKEIVVRTFALQYMDPADAAKLVTPYVDYTPSGGVFSAGRVRGITVRGIAPVIARVDSLLKANDRRPESIRLSYQVVAAVDSSVIDPDLLPLASSLRSVLKFGGYHLIAQGTAMVNESDPSEVSMMAGYQIFVAQARVTRMEHEGGRGSVSLYVKLGSNYRVVSAGGGTTILATGLTAPYGEPVVVGTGAPLVLPMGMSDAGTEARRAIILVVRAEPVKQP